MTNSHILIVEDEPTLQRILGSVLGDAGFEVSAVLSAEEALLFLENHVVDFILSDKNLPKQSGLDLLTEIRGGPFAEIPFVLVTGYPSKESALHLLEYEGDGYWVKPFRSLIDVVKNIQKILAATDARLSFQKSAQRARYTAKLLQQDAQAAEMPMEKLAASLKGVICFTAFDDKSLSQKVEQAFKARGAKMTSVFAEATLFAAARIDDLAAAEGQSLCGKILVDAAPHFSALVQLIDLGGGAVLDASFIRHLDDLK